MIREEKIMIQTPPEKIRFLKMQKSVVNESPKPPITTLLLTHFLSYLLPYFLSYFLTYFLLWMNHYRASLLNFRKKLCRLVLRQIDAAVGTVIHINVSTELGTPSRIM